MVVLGGGAGGGGQPPPPLPVCWANKASRAIFASQSGYSWLIIKVNGTNSVNFVGNSVNFVGNMLSDRNFL